MLHGDLNDLTAFISRDGIEHLHRLNVSDRISLADRISYLDRLFGSFTRQEKLALQWGGDAA